ncbi:hypothetical protein QA646_03995 [Rhizobium sp. CB3090]|uniref:hypothetical protein n=1 Tax=Rhizobium sp. CB3090 TaxID=3039156 RepID=UPI0024B1A2E6|nr:hypothetical protein [Rhizobium sp. CB3090]WFU10039.1 hypothetical protein QA646_03995 [Rhizobium sp. CB3090]
MRIVIIRKNAADLAGPDGKDALLGQKEHIGDGKIDLRKNRKQPEQYPPEAKENDERIACRALSQDFGKTIPAIEAGEVYDQGGVPIDDRAAQAAIPDICAGKLAVIDDRDLKVSEMFLRRVLRQKLVFDRETLNDPECIILFCTTRSSEQKCL